MASWAAVVSNGLPLRSRIGESETQELPSRLTLGDPQAFAELAARPPDGSVAPGGYELVVQQRMLAKTGNRTPGHQTAAVPMNELVGVL